eukprot:g10410.t1
MKPHYAMSWLLVTAWLFFFRTPFAAAAAPADDMNVVVQLSSCDGLLRYANHQRAIYVGGQLTIRGNIDCRHTMPPPYIAFMGDTIVRSTVPLEVTNVLWVMADGTRVTVVAPSFTMRRPEGRRYPLVVGDGTIDFQVNDDLPVAPGRSQLVDAFNLVEGHKGGGHMELSTNGEISYTPDGIFVAAGQASAAAEEAGPKADPPSGSTSDDVDATMPPTVPGPAGAPDDSGNGNGGEGNVHDRTCTDASPSSGCGSDSGSGSGKDRRDEPGDNHSSSGGGEDGGKKDDTDDHDDHHDYHDLFPGFMQPHSGTSLKVGEKLTGALLSPSRESAIYVDRETGIVVHSNLYLTAFGIWALPVPVPLLKPNSRKFNKTMQMWDEIEEEGLEEDKSGGAKNIPKEGGFGFWPWGKGGSRDRRAKEDMKKHAGEVDIEISDKGVLGAPS